LRATRAEPRGCGRVRLKLDKGNVIVVGQRKKKLGL